MLQLIALRSHTARLKALFDKNKTTLYLVASLSVFSCQENSLVNSELTRSELTPSQSSTVALDQVMGVPKKYKLTKYYNQKLAYFPDERIKGFVDASSGLTGTYTYNYTPGTMYSSGSIDVVLHAPFPNNYDGKLTYWFNAGRCYKYQQVNHEPSGDVTLTYILGYNPQGQLIDCLQWLNGIAHGREKYDYNADGDLIKVTSLNAQQVIYRTAILSYIPTNGGAPVNDLYPLNSRWREPNEEYLLRYFGQPSKHLIQSVVETLSGNPNTPKHYYYSYVLNEDGYVTQRKGTYKLGWEPFETAQYEYEVTLIKIPN